MMSKCLLARDKPDNKRYMRIFTQIDIRGDPMRPSAECSGIVQDFKINRWIWQTEVAA